MKKRDNLKQDFQNIKLRSNVKLPLNFYKILQKMEIHMFFLPVPAYN